MTAKFIPRQSFPHYGAIPRSYYLGHHRAGLNKMKNMLNSIDYVVECRDYRVPVTSINPMFEEALGHTRRLIVYTKRDLGAGQPSARKQVSRNDCVIEDSIVRAHNYSPQSEKMIQDFDRKSAVFFVNSSSRPDMSPIIKHLRNDAQGPDNLVGRRVMVVGMPNVGKSTLINGLRNHGMKKAKAAQAGGQPGVTRKIGTPIKIIEKEDGSHVYVLDTPGVFMPYVSDPEDMLKLALCGCVKDSVISPITLTDYLLYRINLHDEHVYQRWCVPTNEVTSLLDTFARSTGLLAKGGIPNFELAASHFIQKWRAGELGKFIMDDLHAEQRRREEGITEPATSISHALRTEKMARKGKLPQDPESANNS